MERREFLRLMGCGLAATWAGGRLSWPPAALAGKEPEVRLALLADAHLQDGHEHRPEVRALARAVAEIRALSPKPDLVCFAGDLAHHGDPRALALGQEILADLPAPLVLVMGEGDGLPDEAGPWPRLFGEPRFSQTLSASRYPGGPSPSPQPSPPRGERGNFMDYSGQDLANFLPRTGNPKPKTIVQVLGLQTSWCPGPAGPGFYVGESGRRWLARELQRLDPGAPLLVLSHAPLARLFRPWQQWTADAPQVLALLSGFANVLCLHGHVHLAEVRDQGSAVRGRSSKVSEGINPGHGLATADRKPETANYLFHQGLPATAWPRPLALQGTPAALRPGLGPHGCGWALLALSPAGLELQPRLWQA